MKNIIEAFNTNIPIALFYSLPFIAVALITGFILTFLIYESLDFGKPPNETRFQEQGRGMAIVFSSFFLVIFLIPGLFFTYPEMKRFNFNLEYMKKIEYKVFENEHKRIGFSFFEHRDIRKKVLEIMPKDKDISLTRFNKEIEDNIQNCINQHTNISEKYKITNIKDLESKIHFFGKECKKLTKKYMLQETTIQSLYL